MNAQDEQRIALWVELLLDDALPEEDFDALEALLLEDEEARVLYLELMGQNAQFERQQVSIHVPRVAKPKKGRARSRGRLPVVPRSRSDSARLLWMVGGPVRTLTSRTN